MMRPDAKVEKVYLYPKPADFRKSIRGMFTFTDSFALPDPLQATFPQARAD